MGYADRVLVLPMWEDGRMVFRTWRAPGGDHQGSYFEFVPLGNAPPFRIISAWVEYPNAPGTPMDIQADFPKGARWG